MEQVAAASGLGLSTLYLIWNNKQGITPWIARGLARAFGTSPDFWTDAQDDYDQAAVSEAPRALSPRVRLGGGRKA